MRVFITRTAVGPNRLGFRSVRVAYRSRVPNGGGSELVGEKFLFSFEIQPDRVNRVCAAHSTYLLTYVHCVRVRSTCIAAKRRGRPTVI